MPGAAGLRCLMVWALNIKTKGIWHLVSWAKLSVVPQLVLVQAGRHFNDVMGLKLYDLQKRCEHAFWNDLQNL